LETDILEKRRNSFLKSLVKFLEKIKKEEQIIGEIKYEKK